MANEKTKSAIELASNISTREAQRAFTRAGRVQIGNILTEQSAQSILECLDHLKHWNLVFNADGQHVDTDANAVETWSEEEHAKLESIIYAQAARGFQYHYAAVPIYDIYHRALMPGSFLNDVYEFLNSEPFLALMRTVTADESITFADAQATRYTAGHFLTRHDDDVAGKDRRAAYVLNLTPDWSPDWGGALQFFDAKGNIDGGFTPAFNVLNLFRVPTAHSVGVVAPFATGSRYAIAGWLRCGADPMLAD